MAIDCRTSLLLLDTTQIYIQKNGSKFLGAGPPKNDQKISGHFLVTNVRVSFIQP